MRNGGDEVRLHLLDLAQLKDLAARDLLALGERATERLECVGQLRSLAKSVQRVDQLRALVQADGEPGNSAHDRLQRAGDRPVCGDDDQCNEHEECDAQATRTLAGAHDGRRLRVGGDVRIGVNRGDEVPLLAPDVGFEGSVRRCDPAGECRGEQVAGSGRALVTAHHRCERLDFPPDPADRIAPFGGAGRSFGSQQVGIEARHDQLGRTERLRLGGRLVHRTRQLPRTPLDR